MNKINKYERIFDLNDIIEVDFFEQLVTPTYTYCKSKNNFIYAIKDEGDFTFIDTDYNIVISIPLEIILDIAKLEETNE